MRVRLKQIFLISPTLIAILVLIWLLFIYRSSTECTYIFYTLMSLSNLTRLHDSRDFTTASLELNSLLAICFSLLCVCWQSFNMNFANWDFFNSGSSGMIVVGRKTTKLDQTISEREKTKTTLVYYHRLLNTKHCSQERITNPQKHCRVKPKWFLDLWTYFEHAHVDEFC